MTCDIRPNSRTMQVDIRDATDADIAAIADIYNYYVRTSICTLEIQELSPEEIQEHFAHVLASGEPFIVAVRPEDLSICGYAYSAEFESRAGYNHTAEDSIYIHKDHCNAGIGKRLLQELVERMKDHGAIAQVVAKISIEPGIAVDQWPSCRLHMSCGFRPVGRLTNVGYKSGEWVDVAILQLTLYEPRRRMV